MYQSARMSIQSIRICHNTAQQRKTDNVVYNNMPAAEDALGNFGANIVDTWQHSPDVACTAGLKGASTDGSARQF